MFDPCVPAQVDLFGLMGATVPGPGVQTPSSRMPSLADPNNLVQLALWELDPLDVRMVVWQSNINRSVGQSRPCSAAVDLMYCGSAAVRQHALTTPRW